MDTRDGGGLVSPPFHGRRWRPSRAKRHRIAERDGWLCWLCLEPVEPEHASLDHVTRRRDGGSHRDRNLRLAHAVCNSIRD